MLRKSPFIIPAQPVLRAHPPKGELWLHEVKFDGYRAQLHKDGDTVTIYSKSGADFTQRFASIAQALTKLPAASAIIDCEIVACTDEGAPNFQLLHSRKFSQECLCAWCFDLLKFDGNQMRLMPLIVRKMNLARCCADIRMTSCGTRSRSTIQKYSCRSATRTASRASSRRKKMRPTARQERLDQGQDRHLARGQQRPRRPLQPPLALAFSS